MRTSIKRWVCFLCCAFWGLLLASGCRDGSSEPSGPLKILALGDSNTGDVNYPGVPPWPTLLGEMRPDWEVVNAGRGNERVQGGRAKVETLLNRHNPDRMVVMYGSVNVLANDTARFEDDLRALVRAGRSREIRVLVCTIPPMVGGRIGFANSVNRLNETIRRVAEEEDAVLVDVFAEFGDDAGERFPDGLHPDLDGQRIIAMAVREKL